jgi:hypothetical protein
MVFNSTMVPPSRFLRSTAVERVLTGWYRVTISEGRNRGGAKNDRGGGTCGVTPHSNSLWTNGAPQKARSEALSWSSMNLISER